MTLTLPTGMTETEGYQMLLSGLQAQHALVSGRAAEIRSQLDPGTGTAKVSDKDTAQAPKKRTMSAEARNKIRLAQKKRWAVYKKQQKAGKGRR